MFSRTAYQVPLPGQRTLTLGPRTLVMGILNVTPDSFSDGGLHASADAAIEAGLAMAARGADLIDVGGESTRPGAEQVPADEERRRVVPVVSALARQVEVPISVDTTKAEVASAAIDAGAGIVNDISGLLYDPALARVVAARRAGLVLMHMRGRPSEMYALARYGALMDEIADELDAALGRALDAGIDRERVMLDPGLGFAKTADQTLAALAQLDAPALQALDRPLVVGPSRKSFLDPAGSGAPATRDWPTAAAVTTAVLAGAHIVRVHRVEAMAEVVRTADAIRAHRTAYQHPG